MDTGSKNIKYSAVTKAIAVFILWLSLAGLLSSAFYAGRYSDMLGSKDYHATSAFRDEFRRYTGYAVDYAVRLRNEAYIKEGRSLPADAASAGGAKMASEPERASAELEAEAQPVGKSEAEIREEYIDKELQWFRDLEKQLSAASDYAYVAVDRGTGLFVTNMKAGNAGGIQEKIDRIKKQPFNIFISKDRREASYTADTYYLDNLRESFRNTSFELYAAAVEPFKKGEPFYDSWKAYSKIHELIPVFAAIAVVSFLIGVVAFIYLIAVAGRKEKGGGVSLGIIDRVYTDVLTLLLLCAAAASVGIAGSVGHVGNDILMAVMVFVILSADMFIGLTYILSMARHIKNRSLLRHTLICAVGKALAGFAVRCMGAKSFKISSILLLLAYGLLNGVFFAMLAGSRNGLRFLVFLLWAGLNAAAVYFVAKALVSLSDIMKWVGRISGGGLEEPPDVNGISPAFSEFARDIRNIQSGLRNAVSEAVKGERLKAELITNVSHDLKTPLTSIINYVDLLKNEETDNESIKQYTGVLVEKANRLKQLIDDLMEASKAASGNLSVNLEGLDLHALALQAAAEFNDKAADAGLDVRIKSPAEAVLIRADGRLMWRILENLFSNVLKYSQRNSRVYLDIERSESFGTITIKNISGSPLDIPADQLMERFVRGDRSRATEGSGLGLAIAGSLAELQGGSLEIKIDGDLFKASVRIPHDKEIGAC